MSEDDVAAFFCGVALTGIFIAIPTGFIAHYLGAKEITQGAIDAGWAHYVITDYATGKTELVWKRAPPEKP